MNKLDREARSRVLHLLCEGNSIRAVTRLTGASKNTVAKLVVDAGHACSQYQDRVLRNLTCRRVQVDEVWNFVYAKQKNVARAKAAPADAGDVWTWIATDADTKLIASWFVGGRDSESAIIFMDDLASRLTNRIQLTSCLNQTDPLPDIPVRQKLPKRAGDHDDPHPPRRVARSRLAARRTGRGARVVADAGSLDMARASGQHSGLCAGLRRQW